MARLSKTDLILVLNNYIYNNGNRGITGSGLNNILQECINTLKDGGLYDEESPYYPYETCIRIEGADLVQYACVNATTGVFNAAHWQIVSGASGGASIWGAITGLITDQADLLNYLQLTYQLISQKNQANGYVGLDGTSKIPAIYLPSYVDDVLEYTNLAAFPVTGEISKIYIALNNGKQYRWSGSTYVEVSPSEVNSVNGLTGIINLALTHLTDFPASYTAQALKMLRVNAVGTGVEFSTEFVKENVYDVINSSGPTYNLTNADYPKQKVRWINIDSATPVTLGVADETILSTVPIGGTIIFKQVGVGQITVVDAGGNIESADGAVTSRTQRAVFGLTKTAANLHTIFGDIL